MEEKSRRPKIGVSKEGEWVKHKLSDILFISNEKNDGQYSGDDVLAASLGTELEKKHIYFGLRATEESVKKYKVVKPGDVIYTKSPIKGFPNGIIRTNKGDAGIVPTLYCVYRCSNEINPSIIQAYFEDKGRLDKYLVPLVNVGARNNVNITDKEFLNGTICIPKDVVEQSEIVKTVEEISKLISIHQQELNRLVCVRKAMVDKMFPQNGNDVPEVRFAGFNTPWKLCPFSEIFTERHVIDTVSEEYPQLSFTIEEGVIRPEDRKTNRRDFLILDKENKKYLQTEYDDIIYNPANVIFGAIHRNALGKGCASPIYKIFYTDQDSAFMECIVRHPRFIKEISRSMEGTVKKLRTLKPKAFLEMSAYIAPTIEEQKQIGEFFRQIDCLIEIEKEELEKIKHIKSACLEKMFV